MKNELCELVDLEADEEFRSYIATSPGGIAFVAEPYGDSATLVVKGDTGDFAKWLGETAPTLKVSLPTMPNRLVLQNEEIWLPLVFLSSDVTLPVFLNMVSSYLYERMKGMLRGEQPRVNLRVVCEDKPSGKIKQFEYSGDAETLKATIKKFDLNNFLDEV